MDQNVISIGQRSFTLTSFTIGQLEQILPRLGKVHPITQSTENFSTAIEVISIALFRQDNTLTPGAIREMEATFEQIVHAIMEICYGVGYLVRPGVAEPGTDTGEAESS